MASMTSLQAMLCLANSTETAHQVDWPRLASSGCRQILCHADIHQPHFDKFCVFISWCLGKGLLFSVLDVSLGS